MTESAQIEHIFIDFENIQPEDIAAIKSSAQCHIWVFLGMHQQKTLPYLLVKSLLRLPTSQIHLVEMQRAGKNALDHCIAFHLGKVVQANSKAFIKIISKDSGFDILIDNICHSYPALNIKRCQSLGSSDLATTATSKPTNDTDSSQAKPSQANSLLSQAIQHLQLKQQKKNLPSKHQTLLNDLMSKFRFTTTVQAEQLVEKLIQKKLVTITDTGKLTYQLPT